MAHRGGGDPGVVTPYPSPGSQFLVRDPGKAGCGRIVDLQKSELRANPGEGRNARSAAGWVPGAKDAELKFGGGDHRDGNLLREVSHSATGLTRDENRCVGDGAHQCLSIDASRTSA